MQSTMGSFRSASSVLAVAWAVALLAAHPVEADQGFFRTVDGYATLVQGDTGASVEVEANYPVLAGDRVEVSERGRVEAVLGDGSYLRIDGGSRLAFEDEGSGGEGTTSAGIRLERGEIQLVLPHSSRAGGPIRVDTVNATVYVDQPGSYRIYTDGRGWTEIVVREGWAEVLTERGSSFVRSGEQSTVNGTRWPRLTLRAAGGLDELEIWGEELLAASRVVTSPYVDARLAYASAPLARHGSWLHVGGRTAWRPAVEVGWRPYYYGYWGYTPAGLTWVSAEPWGWVTYHYGTWDLVAGVGWVWLPGRTYTPASVYWYWGPTHVAWIPAGYYHTYYRRQPYGPGLGLRLGVHGWAGGSITHWSQWTFCASGRFGRRARYHDYTTGAELTHRGRLSTVPRGVIASDTRAVPRDRWNRPADVMAALTRGGSGRQAARSSPSPLPDLTSWVARSPEISAEATRALYGRAETAAPRTESRGVSGTASRSRSVDTPTSPSRRREPVRLAPSQDSSISRETEGRRRWDRDLVDWTRRLAPGAAPRPATPTVPAPRDLVRSDTPGAAGSERSRLQDRYRTGSPGGMGPSGWHSTPAPSPPARRVVDGMRSLRRESRPGLTSPSLPVDRGRHLGSPASPSGSGGSAVKGRSQDGRVSGGSRGGARASATRSSGRSSRGSDRGGG